MNLNDIVFDKHLEMGIFSKELNKEFTLILSDGLEASEEELTDEYRNKISSFINALPQWYNNACHAVITRAKDIYKTEASREDIQLMSIFILFEQNDEELFGLNFRAEFDIEHGCGLKIKGKDGNYEIIEIGTGDVSFC